MGHEMAAVVIESDQRFTPDHVLDVVREFDDIVLDPCTADGARTRAWVMIGLPSDGLAESWSGRIADSCATGVTFVNPPYSRGQVLRWAAKARDEWALHQVESILLVISDTSTSATKYLLQHANAVAFWDKRICFAGDQGAKFANAFFYFGERQGRFRRVFEPHATVLVLR
jgi:hypothetical protein